MGLPVRFQSPNAIAIFKTESPDACDFVNALWSIPDTPIPTVSQAGLFGIDAGLTVRNCSRFVLQVTQSLWKLTFGA